MTTAAKGVVWCGVATAALWGAGAAARSAAGTNTGALTVISSPDRADIIINDSIYLPWDTTGMTLYQLQPGNHTVSVMPRSAYMPGPCSGPTYQDVRIEAGKTAVAQFDTAPAYGTIRIHVRNADTGVPVEEAYIFSNECDDIGHTDAAGDAVSYELAVGRHPLVVFKDGFAHSGVVYVDVAEGQESYVEIPLSPAASTQGRITVTTNASGVEGTLDFWDPLKIGQTTEGMAYGLHKVFMWAEGYLWPPPQMVELGPGSPSATVRFDLVPMPIYLSGSRSYGPLTLGGGVPLSVVIRDAAEYAGGMSAYIVLKKNDGSWRSFVFSGPQLAMVPGLVPVVDFTTRIPAGRWNVITPPLPAEFASEEFFWLGAAVFPAGAAVTLDNWRDKALGYTDETVFVGR